MAIVETGTYLGTTTEWLAAFQMPVFTCESSEENFGFAEARLSPVRNVTATLGDSREFLSRLLKGPLLHARQQPIMFYLDAHWNADLPLAEEVETICRHCPKAVVMIDDFQVPFDAGYGYDDYGPGKALTLEYIGPLIAAHGLKAFYPSTPSAEEGGARRGCVVLAKSAAHEARLGSMPLLRAADAPPIVSAAATDALPDPR